MSFTLRGRLETRLAASLPAIVAACGVTLATHEWWPLQLAALMLGVGVTLDVAFYHRLLPYQPAWLAVVLGLAELAAVVALVRVLGVEAPPAAAYAFFAGTWLIAQVLVHAVFPVARLSYGEDGGELGRGGSAVVAVVLAIGASAGGVAWAAQPPTVRLAAGVHEGPIVLDHAQTLVGEAGAVVRGGIVVTADDVTVRDLTVVGGEHGIDVRDAVDVLIADVTVVESEFDGISARASSLTIRDCTVSRLRSEIAQGIDISFASALPASTVERCSILGGHEGIVSHFANVRLRDNDVRGTTLRGIAVTEMSMGIVEENDVSEALGVAIYCADYSICEIERNVVSGTRPDPASGNPTRTGVAILAHSWATARVGRNELGAGGGDVAAVLNARITAAAR